MSGTSGTGGQQTHRFRIGQTTAYTEPGTGARRGAIILSQLREDDGSLIYGVMFDDGRETCAPEARLDAKFVIDWIDRPRAND